MSPPSKAVLFPWGRGAGHIVRVLALAELLADRYGTASIIVAEDAWDGLVRAAGFPRVRLPDVAYRYGPWSGWDDLRHVQRSVDADARIIREQDADLVVHDARWSAPVAAAMCGVPAATVVQTNMFPGFAFAGRDNKLWESCVPAFNAVLSACGQETLHRDVRELFLRTTMLLPSLPGFDLVPPEYAELVQHVGPLVHRPPNRPHTGVERTVVDRPTAYVYGVVTQQVELEQLLRALDERGFSVVLGALPKGLVVPDWARQVVQSTGFVDVSSVLPSCALAVVHGGHGTAQSVLLAGVPVLCLPSEGHDERWFNAERLRCLGVAVIGDGRERWEQIGDLIDRTLDDVVLRAAARRAAERYRAWRPDFRFLA